MIPNDDKISSVELGAFLFLSIVGIGMLMLPSQLAREVKNDAWVVCIIVGIISILVLYIMCKVGERYSEMGFVGTLKALFGGFFGTLLAIPVLIYAIASVAVELRLFAELTKLYLLYRTPLEFIILPILILTVILVRCGIEPIARSFQIFFPIVTIGVLILVIVNFQRADMSNLRPFLTSPITGYLGGIRESLLAFSGFEIILVLFPFIRKPRKAFRAAATTMILVMILYTIIVVQCIARLGTDETSTLLYPVMALTKSTSIPGGFIEGLEGLLASMWVIFAFTVFTAYLYFFAVIGKDIFKHKKQAHFASLSLPIIYLIALQGNSVPDVIKISSFITSYGGGYTIVLLPVLMLIMMLVRGNKTKEEGN